MDFIGFYLENVIKWPIMIGIFTKNKNIIFFHVVGDSFLNTTYEVIQPIELIFKA